jgi:hypothetical protein
VKEGCTYRSTPAGSVQQQPNYSLLVVAVPRVWG